MIQDALSKITELFRTRSFAYRMVFDPKNQYTKTVMKDLATFCRAGETTFHKDDRLHAALEGRREVFLRIARHLELTPEELVELTKREPK